MIDKPKEGPSERSGITISAQTALCDIHQYRKYHCNKREHQNHVHFIHEK